MDEDDSLGKAAAQKKKEERQKHRQRLLAELVADSPVDWRRVETFQFGEGLNPNYTEPGSHVSTHHLAAYDGQAEVLRWCLREKADVNARTSLGRTVLHYACEGNKTRCIRLLLQEGADANVRTLAQMTPLHFSCLYNSYEAVLVLLDEAKQVVDIDAENDKRQLAETLAKDRRIHKLIKKYRVNFDERRRDDLLEQCLRRLFNLFDKDGGGTIHPEEWADTQMLISEHFTNSRGERVDSLFDSADANRDGSVDWEEFKTSHQQIWEALGVPFREMLNSLADIESTVYAERIRLQDMQEPGEAPFAPVISERAKELSQRRRNRCGHSEELGISFQLPGQMPWISESEAVAS